MRKAFDRQQRLDCPLVTAVPLNRNCRHENIPILRALQHIYSRPAVRSSILREIAHDVNGKSSARRGRPGLSYWEMLRQAFQVRWRKDSPVGESRFGLRDLAAGDGVLNLVVRYPKAVCHLLQ
jgi:hypothetical protein